MSEEKQQTAENPAVSSSSAESPPQSASAIVGPDIRGLSKDMFAKTATYLQGEFEATSEDYRLLENMNKTVTQRYSDMKQVSKNVAKSLAELNEKCKKPENN